MSAVSKLSEIYVISHVSVFKSPENPADAKKKNNNNKKKNATQSN